MTTETIVSHFRACERAQALHRIEQRRGINWEPVWEAAAAALLFATAVLALIVF